MTKDIQVKFTPRQAQVLMSLLKAYAEKSPLMKDALEQLEKSVEYRKSNPSGYRQRRTESRKHLQRSGD
jgi:hypothetical protein